MSIFTRHGYVATVGCYPRVDFRDPKTLRVQYTIDELPTNQWDVRPISETHFVVSGYSVPREVRVMCFADDACSSAGESDAIASAVEGNTHRKFVAPHLPHFDKGKMFRQIVKLKRLVQGQEGILGEEWDDGRAVPEDMYEFPPESLHLSSWGFRGHTANVYRVTRVDTSSSSPIATTSGVPLFASGSGDKTVRVWSFDRGECVGVLRTGDVSVKCLIQIPWMSTSNSGMLVAGGEGSSSGKHPFFLLDVEKHSIQLNPWASSSSTKVTQCIRRFDGATCRCYALDFDCELRGVIGGSDDKTLRVWSLVDSDASPSITISNGDKCMHLALVPESHEVYVSGGSGNVKVWDFRNVREPVRVLTPHGRVSDAYAITRSGEDLFTSVAFTPIVAKGGKSVVSFTSKGKVISSCAARKNYGVSTFSTSFEGRKWAEVGGVEDVDERIAFVAEMEGVLRIHGTLLAEVVRASSGGRGGTVMMVCPTSYLL